MIGCIFVLFLLDFFVLKICTKKGRCEQNVLLFICNHMAQTQAA